MQSTVAVLPYGESLNHRLQIWNGYYRRFHWAVENNVRHLCNLVNTARKFGLEVAEAKVVEVGTGWTPTLPVGLYLLGAEVHTYDHMCHVRAKNLRMLLEFYPQFIPRISDCLGIDASRLSDRLDRLKGAERKSVRDWLGDVGIHYHAPGDAAKTEFADSSVDLYFSVAVMEHVPKVSVEQMIREARRILRLGGLSYHHIGLHDHLAETDASATKINFLKFGDLSWKILGQNRIQYHNRLRRSEFVKMFDAAGLEILECESKVDEASLRAIPRMRLNKKYRLFEADDLATYELTICSRNSGMSASGMRRELNSPSKESIPI